MTSSAPGALPRRAALALLGAGELAALSALGWWPGADFPGPGLVLFGAAFAAYAAAAVFVGRFQADARHIWWVAVALRAALFPLAPELSDDVYRYLWDGHVQLSGVNPFLHPPAAEALATLRTAYHPLVNNPDVPTIYPPFAQLAFLAIALVGGGVFTAKLAWLAFDLATGWALGKVAAATGRDPRRVQVLYLWSPLLVVEVAWSAHLEPLGLFGLALAILLAARPVASGAALGLATLTKVAPVAALPALTRARGPRALLAFAGVVALLYAPYAEAGAALFTGLRAYGEHWWFMKGPFGLLEAAFGDPVIARRAAGGVVAGVVGWTVLRRHDVERALLWVLGAGMLLTPTLHPWYALWMLPMAALRGSRPWILFSGLAFLGYFGLGAYQDTGTWPQPPLVRLAMWGPLVALLAAEGVVALRGAAARRGAGGEALRDDTG